RFVSPPLAACLFVHPEGSLPKPSISVSPGGVIPVGGNVIIRCRHQRLDLRFLLYKDEDGNYLTYTDPAGSEAEFPITSAIREQSGNYTCRYSNRTGPAAYSEPSDPVQIIVAGEGPSPAPRLPAPHPARPRGISLSPGTQWMGRPASEGWVCRGDLSPLEVDPLGISLFLQGKPRGSPISLGWTPGPAAPRLPVTSAVRQVPLRQILREPGTILGSNAPLLQPLQGTPLRRHTGGARRPLHPAQEVLGLPGEKNVIAGSSLAPQSPCQAVPPWAPDLSLVLGCPAGHTRLAS
uniref:Uncharacterized protein n=1 Tax=Terrapene triunguis TaxID=2587831 RepID=A0A674IB96_9SAUR